MFVRDPVHGGHCKKLSTALAKVDQKQSAQKYLSLCITVGIAGQLLTSTSSKVKKLFL